MKLGIPGSRRLAKPRAAVMAGLAAAVVFAASFVVVPVAPVLAAPPTPGSKPSAPAVAPKPQATRPEQVQGVRLERLFKREQERLEYEQKRLDAAAERATKVQQFIDDQKSKGKDTSGLEAALAAFKDGVATAQGHHETAKGILDTHAGFDANGKVTDLAQARTTVRTAGKAEVQFHRTMVRADLVLLKAIREYRRENGVGPEGQGPQGNKRQ